ncbi:MAG TPA: type VI secretion system baseplate subunit TssG [Candidatus Acidoferrum sp.]|nr:type VI secretion system baseplate subunit TssG [Candidatus Acidoferrum sp.]
MATPGGGSDSPVDLSQVEEQLREEPYRFEFFQAIRLLERLAPDRKPVGRFTIPSEEVARLGAYPSLSFPASEIQSIDWPEGKPPSLAVNFMGVTGPQGPLPHFYTTLILARLRSGDKTLRDFLDLFHHRMLSFFYQAWEKYRFAISYERGERDRFSHHLLDLIGLGTAGLQERLAVPDDAFLFFAGILGQRPHSAHALELLLNDYFEVPVAVIQLVGGWFRLDDTTECCIGERSTPSEQLGLGAVVGDEVWNQQARARIRIGPLALEDYLDFLPNGSAFEPLRALLRFWTNEEIDFEVQLILEREEVPRCQLGGDGDAAPQLGWVTWMKSTPMDRHPEETIFNV